MFRSPIPDPEKFQLASIVTKNSRTGITSNRRLLVVRGGHLYYYSNIPKSFTGDNVKILDQFHQLPKCSIEILNIIKINGFQATSSYFSIEFQSKHMLQREDIRRTLINEDYNFTPKNTKELVTWQFTCDNQFIKQKWVSSLTSLKEHFKNQQANIQKYFDGINAPQSNEEIKSSNGSISSRSSLKISPWRESAVSRKSYTIESNKGFQFREGSPKQSSNKLQEPHFLKKGRSEDLKTFQYPQFEMIIKQEPPEKIEDVFKLRPIQKLDQHPKEQIKSSKIIQNPIIEQVVQQVQIQQTPIKQNSYSDSQDQIQNQIFMQKNFDDLKIFTQTKQNSNIQQPTPSIIEQIKQLPKNYQKIPILELVEQKQQPKIIKIQGQFNKTPRSNLQLQQSYQEQNSQFYNNNQKQCTIGYQFQWLVGQSCRGNTSFDYKLEKQKQLIYLIEVFKQKAISNFSSWLESKSKGQERYHIIQQSSHIKYLEIQNILFKIATVSTQNIFINGKQKIFFNQDAVKNLKRQYKIYQNLCKMMMKKLKYQPRLALRIPLAVFIQLKGVTCIAFQQKQQTRGIQISNEDQKWLSQRSVLIEQGYKLDWFDYKSNNDYLLINLKTRGKNIVKDQQGFKQYLKKIIKIGSLDKNHNIIFQSPIDKTFLEIAAKQNASTSIQSMEKYIKGLKNTKLLQGTCSKQQIISALQYCLYCKNLRKIYRSAQGQIDQTHFFNLVFKQDPSMMTLLDQSSCQKLSQIKGIIFSFIQHYFGVTLQIDAQVFKDYYINSNQIKEQRRRRKDLFFSSTTVPLLRQYPFYGLQIIQSFSKLTIYLESRHHLAEAALNKKKQIFHLCSDNLALNQNLQLLYDQASFYYYESDFISCIKKCKEYQQICPHQYTKLFSVYLLMMKAYSQFSQDDFSITLSKATQIIQYNYGLEHSSLISLFSLSSFYYAKLSQKPNSNKNIDLTKVSIQLMKKAADICLLHFGSSSKQYLDILLDLSRIYRRIDSGLAAKYFQDAKKLCQQEIYLSNHQNIVSILTYQTEFNLQIGNLSQAQSALLNGLLHIDENISPKTKKHLLRLEFQVGFYIQKYRYCEEAVQYLWGMSNNQKVEAVGLAYKAAMRQAGISGSESLIDGNDSARFEGRSKSLIQIEKCKLQFSNLVEMISNAIEAKNTHLLTMIYFLSRI